MTQWLYENKEFNDPSKYFGFIYSITNLLNNKVYIGRKYFTSAKTKQPLK